MNRKNCYYPDINKENGVSQCTLLPCDRCIIALEDPYFHKDYYWTEYKGEYYWCHKHDDELYKFMPLETFIQEQNKGLNI